MQEMSKEIESWKNHAAREKEELQQSVILLEARCKDLRTANDVEVQKCSRSEEQRAAIALENTRVIEVWLIACVFVCVRAVVRWISEKEQKYAGFCSCSCFCFCSENTGS